MKKRFSVAAGLLAAALCGGCTSSIVPMRPVERVAMWQRGDGVIQPLAATRPSGEMGAVRERSNIAVGAATTAPTKIEVGAAETEPAKIAVGAAASAPSSIAVGNAATAPAEELIAGTEPATAATQAAATQPAGHEVMREVDPNQTVRFVYKATYDNIWRQSQDLLRKMGFLLDRQDYREGVLITRPLLSSQVVEVWRPQQVNLKDALENTINSQRRVVRLTIHAVPGKPDFYEIAVQVVVERVTNPTEQLGGPLFIEGSGFGRNVVALRSDYAPVTDTAPRWVTVGHDVDMEKKVLKELFRRI